MKIRRLSCFFIYMFII